MKLVGKGDKETVLKFIDRVHDEFSFNIIEEVDSDYTEATFDIDTTYIDQKIFEVASFINMEISIVGNGWKLVKPVGKGFEYKVS